MLEPEIKIGYDLIFAAKDGSLTADSLEETLNALQKLLRAARLFDPSAQNNHSKAQS